MKHLPYLFVFILLLIPAISEAQRQTTPYEALIQRSDRPNSYITDVLLPSEDGATVGALFRLDYDLIPFLRVRPDMNDTPDGAEYFAPIQMGIEFFEGRVNTTRRNQSNNMPSVYRDSYLDTVYVSSFEQTRSRQQHVQGVLNTSIEPGSYNYELQLTRAQSTEEQSSTRRNIEVPSYDTLSRANVMLLSNFNSNNSKATGTFLNYGDNVLYGSDYSLMIVLPNSETNEDYNVEIYRMESGRSDDTMPEPTFEYSLTSDEIISGANYQLNRGSDGVEFTMDITTDSARFGVVSVPNSGFENARYRIQILDSEDQVLGSKTVNSRWLDMPISLLNIDVAINMMRFIVSDSELDRLQRGSSAEKERKFREYWEQRDPTPDTEFNELMTEYYNRIDYAYRNFTTPQTPGYESDQGHAYILYGQPDNVKRRLPTDQPTRELWEYPNRTLVFEATTGFGDFKLVEERQ
ncbi:GWxTD domain-containing protein [Rhodohalobacter sp. 8-1]|uniref:GWxTD domain-containing protein n=1 Tax=Rhodohalobacter sp. 8-1 TaxID=3131972 RepID=UPI0030EC3477